MPLRIPIHGFIACHGCTGCLLPCLQLAKISSFPYYYRNI